MTDLIAKNNEIAPPGFEPGSEDIFDGNILLPSPKSPMLSLRVGFDHYTTGL